MREKMVRSMLLWPVVFLVLTFLLRPTNAEGVHGSDDILSQETISAAAVKYFLEAGEKFIFIDLRPTKEFELKRIPGARSIPLPELPKRFAEVPRAGRVVLYCDCPEDEIAKAAQLLRENGYRNIMVMTEAFEVWLKRKYPVEIDGRK